MVELSALQLKKDEKRFLKKDATNSGTSDAEDSLGTDESLEDEDDPIAKPM